MAQVVSHTISINKYINEEIESSYKDNVQSYLDSQINEIVSSTKIESIYGTPSKVDPQNVNSTNYTNENTNSPKKNIFLFDERCMLKSPLLKSPQFKKWDKSAQFVDTAQTNACLQGKRTISANSDYDTFKLESYNTESFNNFESIDLLHDLDSVVKFDDSKDIFLSLVTDINTTQEDDSLLGVSKDPATDPLSISDCEKKDIDTLMDSDSKFSKKYKIKVKSRTRIKKQGFKHHFKKQKRKLGMEEKHLLEELKNLEEWEEMPLIAIKKLLELRIKLVHKVPPQHKIEVSGSHAPTRKAKILFQKHGPIRKGSYTPTEDKIIRRNWEMFCKLHNWDMNGTQPFLYWRHNGRYYINDVEERQKFVQFLANGLPWRTLYSVYSRFKILYRNKITYTRYTSEEDKKIFMYIQNKHLDERDTKYTELAKLLKRTNRSIFKRYQYLKKTQDKSKTELLVDVRWTLPLIKKFIKTLLDMTLSEDIRELKDAMLPKPVWQKMEEKLNIHENTLKTFWQHQLHLQLFSTGPIYLNDIKILLIEYMYRKGISNTREIIWSNVARYFDGATAAFLCKTFFYLVQECNLTDMDNFVDIVEYLYHTKIPEIMKAPTDKFLPRIMYRNGQVSLLNVKNSKTITTDTDHKETDYTNSTSDSDC